MHYLEFHTRAAGNKANATCNSVFIILSRHDLNLSSRLFKTTPSVSTTSCFAAINLANLASTDIVRQDNWHPLTLVAKLYHQTPQIGT